MKAIVSVTGRRRGSAGIGGEGCPADLRK